MSLLQNQNLSELLLAIDFGSTHACAHLYTHELRKVAESVVHKPDVSDPTVCWNILCKLIENVLLAGTLPPSSVAFMGISVQRNSFLIWDKITSTPVTTISSWQDKNATEFASKLNSSKFIKAVNKSGQLLYSLIHIPRFILMSNYKFSSIFTCTRLAHAFSENPELKAKCLEGSLVYGCLETWFLWRLTHGKAWCTDVSCTSATGMYDPCNLDWSPFILNCVKLSADILPSVCPTSSYYGEVRCGPLARTNEEIALGMKPVRVTTLIGDSQAAMLGEGCIRLGEAKLTLGTGAFLNVNIGNRVQIPQPGCYPVVGWAKSTRSLHDTSCESKPDKSLSNLTFLHEGNNSEAGITVTNLKNMGLFNTYEELENMLTETSNKIDELHSRRLFYCPSSVGIRRVQKIGLHKKRVENSLVFLNTNSTLKDEGMFIGLPELHDLQQHSKKRLSSKLCGLIMFAVFDSIATSAKLLVSITLGKSYLDTLTVLRINGNLSRSNWLMQRLADTLGLPVERSPLTETCCLGTAISVGVGAGIWKDYASAVVVSKLESHRYTKELLDSGNPCKCRFVPDVKKRNLAIKNYQMWYDSCFYILQSSKRSLFSDAFTEDEHTAFGGGNDCANKNSLNLKQLRSPVASLNSLKSHFV